MHDESLLKLENIILGYRPDADLEVIRKAYEIAEKMHDGQLRKSGEPFVIHPIEVATMLAEMNMDLPSIAAGMLHDVVEDTPMTYDDVATEFGVEIANLVDGVTKLKKIPTSSKEEQQAENLRKMFLSMASDIRVILIKLVDRLHNMRTLQYVTPETQMKKAKETLEIYTPLAHRLGITKIKWELEDLCFKYLDPEGYEDLVKKINQKREEQEEYIKKVLDTTRARTVEMGIRAFFDGRPKHLSSVRRKMQTQNKTIDQIYDLLAVRIIVDTVPDCYIVLGILHDLYKPMPGRFKDYISMPKPNQYQSLHTTLIGPDGFVFEAQIRTWEMHKTAEIGIAAHWKYKQDYNSTTKTTAEFDKKLEWVRNLFDLQKDMSDSAEFVETFKMDLFTDEVFVFTPKGDVKSLPAGSTPIDFAYEIHSAVGHRMVGAKVNNEIKPLNYRLKNGDIVEIITSSSPNKGPSRDWLSIVKSSQARSKIRQWFKKERRDENIERGRELVEQELKKYGYSFAQLFCGEWLDAYLKKCNLATADDLLNVIGFGEISAKKTVARLKEEYERINNVSPDKELEELIKQSDDKKEPPRTREKVSDNGIIVKGIDNCLVRLACCCNPVPGDSIIGYITRGRGVSVHRTDCPNIVSMTEGEDNRMISVRWAGKSSVTHLAEIIVKAVDNRRLLLQVANLINDMRISMKSINARTTRDAYQIIDLVIEITDKEQLEVIINKMRQLDNVVEVSRAVR